MADLPKDFERGEEVRRNRALSRVASALVDLPPDDIVRWAEYLERHAGESPLSAAFSAVAAAEAASRQTHAGGGG